MKYRVRREKPKWVVVARYGDELHDLYDYDHWWGAACAALAFTILHQIDKRNLT